MLEGELEFLTLGSHYWPFIGVVLVSQLIETAAHQLAPLSTASCFPWVPIVTSRYYLQGREGAEP